MFGKELGDYICTLMYPDGLCQSKERREFKKPNKCALAEKHGVSTTTTKNVQSCICRVLMQEEYGSDWCPGAICHTMSQSNYSKDFQAGDDFGIRGYNLTDAAKCCWYLENLVKEMHQDDELPLLKIRVAPAEKEDALDTH